MLDENGKLIIGKYGDPCVKCGDPAINGTFTLCGKHTDEYRKRKRAEEQAARERWRASLNFDFDLIEDLEFDGIDHGDYPDYCDAYVSGGSYDGRDLTEEELEFLNDDSGFVYESLMEYLY